MAYHYVGSRDGDLRNQRGERTMKTPVKKAAIAVFALGLILCASSQRADAFGGHHRTVATGYAPVVTTGYAPVVAAAPLVVAWPVVAASPVVTTGFAPAYATTSFSLPSVPVTSAVVAARPVI